MKSVGLVFAVVFALVVPFTATQAVAQSLFPLPPAV